MTRGALAVLCSFFAALAMLPCGTASAAPQTVLVLDSQPGDPIGDGKSVTYTLGSFDVSPGFPNGVQVDFHNASYSHRWRLDVSAPTGTSLLGAFEGATSSMYYNDPFHPLKGAGLNIYGDGTSCMENLGRFVVLELARDASGHIARFAADMEQHCDGAKAALFASIRYNSEVSIEPRIMIGDALVQKGNAGQTSGKIIAALSMPSTSLVSVAYATADGTARQGVDYRASSGVLHFAPGETAKEISIPIIGNRQPSGPRSIAIGLRSPVTPVGDGSAIVKIQDPNVPITAIALNSSPGDWVGAGKHWLFTGDNLGIIVSDLTHPAHAAISSTGPYWWHADFKSADRTPLKPGVYLDARRMGYQGKHPGLEVTGDHRGCNALTGAFRVNEYTAADQWSIDFIQSCEGYMAPLFGSISVNAMLHQASVSDATIANGHAIFIVTLNPPGTQTESVHFTTVDGTARAGIDYTAVETDVTFLPGEIRKHVAVPVLPRTVRAATFQARITSDLTPIWIEAANADLQ